MGPVRRGAEPIEGCGPVQVPDLVQHRHPAEDRALGLTQQEDPQRQHRQQRQQPARERGPAAGRLLPAGVHTLNRISMTSPSCTV